MTIHTVLVLRLCNVIVFNHFFIIIIIPILLITASGKAIITYQLNSIQEAYDVESDTLQVITNPLQILNRLTRDVFNRIKLCAIKEPAELEDMSYIASLNEEITEKYSFLVVRKEDQFVFAGDEVMLSKIKKSLPKFGEYSTEVDGGIYVGGKHPFLLKQQDFYFSDGSEGTVFVVTDVNTLVPQIKQSAIQAVVSFVVIISMTAFLLIMWLYRSIIRPLDTLKKATKEMKEGNLDFSISGSADDEIGQLCQDFEEMRIHLKELIEVRMQYERESRELISNISHDLKTPLTAIKGYAEGLIDGVADTPERQEKYLKTIYTKASDMSVLVDELSLYSKIDSNTVPYNFSIINVADYFNDCIDELRFDLEVKNIRLGYEYSANPDAKAIADAEQLKRVINNIIGNAVKYMDKKEGRLNVRVKEISNFIQVEIEDNGAGISRKDLPNIFDRFYRADASRNSKKGGTGLGLAIAKKIIEEHEGRIWATSVEGAGTTMYFTIRRWMEKKPDKKLDKPVKEGRVKIKE